MDAALFLVPYTAAVVAAAWVFYRRASLRRPWIGVIDLRDAALMFAVVAVSPYLYVVLPAWGATVVAAGGVALAFQVTFGKVEGARRFAGIAAAAAATVIAADVGAALLAGERSNAFALVNGVVLGLLIVGMASLFVQCGMRARDVALLACALALYESLASSQLTLMADLFEQAGDVPFAPAVGWWQGGEGIAVGFADLLLAAVFPLAARKAFGRVPGLLALLTSLASVALVVILADRGTIGDWPPAVVLGPLFAAQYCWWVRGRGRERTTWEYLREEPVDAAADPVPSPFAAEPEGPRPAEA